MLGFGFGINLVIPVIISNKSNKEQHAFLQCKLGSFHK